MNSPLANKLRPKSIDKIVGQKHLVGENGFIRKMLNSNKVFSMIFYGPPGTGKTTLATIIATSLNIPYCNLNATINSKKDIEEAILEAKFSGKLVVIMDEVHRLNKDKQDILLSYIESGLIILIGATTSNPYHSINPAIRSRCHLLEFKPLDYKDIIDVLNNAIVDKDGLNNEYKVDNDAIEAIAKLSNGDVRFALNCLEIASIASNNHHITINDVSNNINSPSFNIDNDGDGHYDAVSALQKSIRGSDVDAALYYLARLIAANDLDSIERRLLVTAYEDVGLGNPNAVSRTYQAIQTAKIVGFPEATIPLGVAVVDLALSPKSKSGCLAIEKAVDFVNNNPLPVPPYLKLTPVGLNKEDKYPYDREDLWDKIQYLPEQIKNIRFYEGNTNSSYEKVLVENNNKLHSYKRSSNLRELRK